jgi:hypothetical protein
MAMRKKGSSRPAKRKPARKDGAVEARPRAFTEWREPPFERDEDAAHAFGHHLIAHCRDEALNAIPAEASPESRDGVMSAVDVALHNVCSMLEGFWRLDIDPAHHIELALEVRICNASGEVVETRGISPGKLDLPIGYWKWARDREFR